MITYDYQCEHSLNQMQLLVRESVQKHLPVLEKCAGVPLQPVNSPANLIQVVYSNTCQTFLFYLTILTAYLQSQYQSII